MVIFHQHGIEVNENLDQFFMYKLSGAADEEAMVYLLEELLG